MTNSREIKFGDDVYFKFFYDYNKRIIEAHFDGGTRERPTLRVLTIESWREAQARKTGEKRYNDLDCMIGVFSMIFDFKFKDNRLDLVVDMVDQRIVEIYFIDPKVKCTLDGETIFSYGYE